MTSSPSDSGGDGVKYPDTLAPQGYYEGLVDRISLNLVPVLKPYLTQTQHADVLEISSGNGTHIAVYAKAFEGHVASWTPTEADQSMRRECDSTLNRLLQGTPHVRARVQPTRVLDVMDNQAWSSLQSARKQWDIVLAHNCIHMIPCS